MTEQWYDEPMRWGQLNLKEDDPRSLDVAFWADYWRRTRIDGVTLNAGGGIAFYPTVIPLHYRARYLGDRDLFGELVAAAKAQGMRTLARLDPNVGHADLYAVHPDWFLTDAAGAARQRGQTVPMARHDQFGSAARDTLYSTCWNSPFHRQFMLDVMAEIMQRYDVDGFFTNGWPPIGGGPPDLSMVCYCPHCRERWQARGNDALPERADPADPKWRDFVRFVQESVENVQRLWQDHTKQLKASATFVWNSHGSLATGLRWERFIELGDLLDDDTQGRRMGIPLFASGQSAKVMQAVAKGKPVFRLFGTWQVSTPPRRHTAKPQAEQTLFIAEAVANGERPWWHTLGGARASGASALDVPEIPAGASHDPRWMDDVAAYFQWHAQHDHFLRDHDSLAEVGLIWSPPTLWLERWAADSGQQRTGPSTVDAINGWHLALLEARIPFDLLPPWKLTLENLSRYRTLILPSATCLEDSAAAAITRYVASGGGLVALCEASLRNEWGDARPDYALAETFGVRRSDDPPPPLEHCYMRIGGTDQHSPLLSGLRGTEILPGGSWLSLLRATTARGVTTLVPTYPTAPPEKVYMDRAQTDTPLILVNEAQRGRSIYFAQDIDAALWRSQLPDHRRLLGNAVRWVRGDRPIVTVDGPGLVDVAVWRQEASVTVHLVNLSIPNLWTGPVTECLPVGAQIVQLRVPTGGTVAEVRLLRSGSKMTPQVIDGVLTVAVPSVMDYEIIAVGLRQGSNETG